MKLVNLYQRYNKSLFIYYKKTCNFIKNINIKNRFISILIFSKFNFFKSIFLNIIFRVFIRGFINYEIQKKITRDIIFSNRLLFIIYILIKKIRRIKIEIQKFLNKKIKINKL